MFFFPGLHMHMYICTTIYTIMGWFLNSRGLFDFLERLLLYFSAMYIMISLIYVLQELM